ncbi:metabolite traffic protein EboE [Muricauda sp. 2012CJ35-5]|uniref:Metabolite traffic protein EboE n=1 Tax=Flagellimonas spongiicola TaxID=2942208 RepID=A0ABT0PXD5_9FLAO|nr:metabolite traffic protein EboE [Allomuricauda spongiicola]MCL6275377.1 metabolite traffic protein EboE [Allomuricauda spongiicola]
MLVADNYQLTYCTNIHQGENWKVTFDNLKKYVPVIKQEVAPTQKFGLGLRLSNKASEELAADNNLFDFKRWLNEEDIYVFTMNGFPFGNFHGERVKDMVHAPDWTTEDRLVYTKRLFHQLSELLPEGISGGISTSPISYKYWHKSEEDRINAMSAGAKHMLQVAIQLYETESESGKYMHLDIEPEPDGLLENSDEVVQYFADYLLPIGIPMFMDKFDLDEETAAERIKKYLTVCYDICHFSLAFENPKDTFAKFDSNGIRVGKIQVSAALKILFDKTNASNIWEALEKFNEPTYLHQVTRLNNGKVRTYSDLPELFADKNNPTELRAHFHVPIFLEEFDYLNSTQDQILDVLEYLREHPKLSEHLEVETYTWDVLPSHLKSDLSESIVRELQWLKNRLEG